MRVKYQVEREDYVAFNIQHVAGLKTTRNQKLIGWLVVPCVFLFLGLLIGMSLDDWWALVTLSVLGTIYAACYPWMYRRALMRQANKIINEHSMVGIEGLWELILDEETVTEVTECWRFEIKWRYVHRIVETETHAFIYQTALSAAIIPKRFFLTEEEFHKLVDYAKQRLAACKSE